MFKNDQLNALKFISETHRNIHANRINQEFKLTVMILTFYILSIKFVLSNLNYFNTENCFLTILIWIIFISIAIMAFIYLEGSGSANSINQGIAEKAEDKIIESLKNDSIDIIFKPNTTHPNRHRWLWQALIIFLIAILSAAAITHIINKKNLTNRSSGLFQPQNSVGKSR